MRFDKNVLLIVLIFYLDRILCKGLYSGVPCHRSYYCIFEEIDDGFENSVLIGEEENVKDEKLCQYFCSKLEECVSYTWWNERAKDHPDGRPFLCQMFAICHRNYHNPNLTPAYSGLLKKLFHDVV